MLDGLVSPPYSPAHGPAFRRGYSAAMDAVYRRMVDRSLDDLPAPDKRPSEHVRVGKISAIVFWMRMRFGLTRNTANKPLQYIRIPKGGAR